jgi:hypothetical protein
MNRKFLLITMVCHNHGYVRFYIKALMTYIKLTKSKNPSKVCFTQIMVTPSGDGMSNMHRIDMQTMTLYAELLEQMQVLEVSRTIADLRGSFSTKVIRGDTYVYFVHYLPGGKTQSLCVGKEGPATEALIQQYSEGKIESQEARENVRRLAAQVKAGCGIITDKAMTRVLEALAEAAVFRSGAVLVGTHAFRAIGVMLGLRWFPNAMFTMDVDIAAEKVAVALPYIEADIPSTIDSLEMGFFPVPALNHKHPSTSYAIRKKQLRLDILTPKTIDSDAPVAIPRFKCAAQPLSYLNYLIEDPVPAVLLDADPVLVNVPQPIRFALHKLIVSQLRDITSVLKSKKDLQQAYQILSALREDRPLSIRPAWDELISRGSKWKRHAEAGLEDMIKEYGDNPLESKDRNGHDTAQILR